MTGRVAYVHEAGPESFETGVSLIDFDGGDTLGSLLDGLQGSTVEARANGL